MERNMDEAEEARLRVLEKIARGTHEGGRTTASEARYMADMLVGLFDTDRIGYGAPDTGHQLIYATEVICPRCSAAPGDSCTEVTITGRRRTDTACEERVDLLRTIRRDLGLTQ